nr:hypothetical protein [Tanacetum cinerariifolium]
MSLSLVENVIVTGADNRQSMLDKSNYRSWVSRMLLYIQGMPNGKLLVDFVLNGPFQFITITVPETESTPATVRERTYTDLIAKEKLHESIDIIAINIVLQGSELTKQERESKPYDDFDMFTSQPVEIIHLYDLRFAQLINDMYMIGTIMQPIQINTKFVNHLPTEWGKFVTDIKLAKNTHTTKFDHLYAHLKQGEAHANEVHLNRQRFSDMIALEMDVQQSYHQPQLQQSYQASPMHQSYQVPAVQQPTTYQPPLKMFSQLDSGLVVPSFNTSDDLIVNLNKAGAFLNSNASRFIPKNNQNNAVTQGTNKTGGQAKVQMIKCYNCQEDGHMARECTKPKRPKNSTWFKEKLLLTKALESWACLDLEQLAFLADNRDAVLIANLSSYDSAIISEVVHGTNLNVQQDEILMSVINEKTSQVAMCNKVQQEIRIVNETLTTELERFKEQIIIFEQRQKFDLTDKEKYIDAHKTALGYQNPFYLAQAHRKVPALYDGHTIMNTHDALFVPDSEETFKFAEESRLKMHAKQNDPDVIEKKVNTKLVDYVALNKLSEHFEKHFVPKKHLFAEQAFSFPVSQPQPQPIFKTPLNSSTQVFKEEIPRELP